MITTIKYTRPMAIADGVHIAFTRAAWANAIVRGGRVDMHTEGGRVWDALCYLTAVVKTPTPGAECLFTASRPSKPSGCSTIRLKAILGRDDEGKCCLTVMLPHED